MSRGKRKPQTGNRKVLSREKGRQRIASRPRALVGAKRIALYAFDDEEKWRWVYTLKDDLGLFYMRGRLCGNPDTIDQRLQAKEIATRNAI
jgi:hypothetical protein